jgi:hypothetical protein
MQQQSEQPGGDWGWFGGQATGGYVVKVSWSKSAHISQLLMYQGRIMPHLIFLCFSLWSPMPAKELLRDSKAGEEMEQAEVS